MAAAPFVIKALMELMQGAAENRKANQARSGLRRGEREMMEDTRARVEGLRFRGDQFLAQKKVNFLKNGVQLAGSPLIALAEDEKRIKEEISAVERAAEAEASQSKKARRQLRRSGRLALLGGGIAAAGSLSKAKD